jgi:hypothetical protein
MLRNLKNVVVVSLLAFYWLGSPSYAQQKTIQDGVFTEAQISTGKIAYDTGCLVCHNTKFFTDIWSGWQDRTLMNFWNFIVAEMPSDNPGSLLDQEYTDAIAYILWDLGFPSGETALDPLSGMDEIIIVAQ